MDKPGNIISYDIRGAIYDVYNTLGPGLFESVYETALSYELEKKRMPSEESGSNPFLL
ncbi:hypothetical protein MNBD_BACTEROID01-1618 [hydrothermal vent metagenome]|uniref:GxxExxY protein n=1 Tax=hydrothermal vent metagenome TaxID=652676 RepID=A0A3B0U9Y7_9ZZZZ